MSFDRRSMLKGSVATGALFAAQKSGLLGFAEAWAQSTPFTPEAGAKLQLLRWKRFVQSEEDSFMELMAAFTNATGVPIEVLNESMDDVQPKASVAANVGSGPDIVWGVFSLPHLFPDKCLDLTDLATGLGAKYGGWIPAAEKYGKSGDRWIGIPICFGGNYINYRISAVEQAGFSDGVPADNEGFLELCRALKGIGSPAGMALGHATGDGNAWTHWALWSHGAAMVDENDRVILDSPEAVKACDYVKALHDSWIPGTASWNDGSNNKAFLAGEVSLTNNGISIYQKALVDGLDIKDDMDHAYYPIGPAGVPTELHISWTMLAFEYTKYPQACKALIDFMMEKEQYDKWLEGSVAYLTHPLNAYDKHPIWTSDPKRTIFRDAGKRTLVAGHRGTVGEKAAAAIAEFIVVDMFANVATGQMSSAVSVKDAARKARRIYR